MLGSFRVGDQSNIGANSVVLKEVPPNSTVVGIPGKIVKRDGKRVDRLNQQLPDPVVDSLRSMQQEIERLRDEMRTMQSARETERERDTINGEAKVNLAEACTG